MTGSAELWNISGLTASQVPDTGAREVRIKPKHITLLVVRQY